MAKTRALFIPSYLGIPSHFIPLVKLYQLLDPVKYEAAFFLPIMTPATVRNFGMARHLPDAEFYYCGEFYSHFDLPILGLAREYSITSEVRAYVDFKPDVIIDDCNLITPLTSQVAPKPRITVLRSVGAQSSSSGRPGYQHSLQPMIDTLNLPLSRSLQIPKTLESYFEADAYIVPGIDAIERTLPAIPDTAPLFFSGPLILDSGEEDIFMSEALQRFFAVNTGRYIAYLTLGFSPGRANGPRLTECIRHLINKHFAVLTNARITTPRDILQVTGLESRLFVSSVFPMHYVTSKSDVIIHIGGSGMYHYPIIHLKPAITVGSQTYDREAINSVLADLGLSISLPSPAETDRFEELFKNAIDRFLRAEFPFDSGLAERLRGCRQSICGAAQEFDFAKAITCALDRRTP
jgi:hypothetical protein